MDEEEPMDISGEGQKFNSPYEKRERSLPFRPQRRDTFQKCATIATSSPSRFKDEILNLQKDLDSLRTDIFQERRKRNYVTSPARMRRLNYKATEDRKVRSRPEKPCSLNDDIENKKKDAASLYQKTRNKFLAWAVAIGVCFGLSLLLKDSDCQFTVDYHMLNKNFEKHVFGQHIATHVIVSTLRDYSRLSKSQNNTDMKPLVFSFHGWTGVGKNLVTKILAKSVQKKKVKVFSVPTHFAHSSLDSVYNTSMSHWLKSNISQCTVSIFIFDEMDKATDGLLAGLHSTLFELRTNKLNNSWVIFVFLSNSKGSKINSLFFSAMSEGQRRESVKYELFEPLLTRDIEGEWYENMHKDGLIDLHVPFLPMNRECVYQCIERDMLLKRKFPKRQLVEQVAEQMNFFRPEGSPEDYSVTGCKRVSDKVDLLTIPENSDIT